MDVDAAEALAEQTAPVVSRRLHAKAEEGQSGKGEQRVAGCDRRIHDQRLADVGQDMADDQPAPTNAGQPGRGDEVQTGDARDKCLSQAGEARGDREADRQ
jgi:hypothetical protein